MISTINLNKRYQRRLITYTMVMLLATVAVSTAASTEDMMLETEKGDWQAIFHPNVKEAPAGG